MVLRLLPG